MVVIKKNQIIVAALIAVIGVAGYIGYTDSGSNSLLDQYGSLEDGVAVEASKINDEETNLGDAIFTDNEKAQKSSTETNKDTAAADKQTATQQTSTAQSIDYFVSGKLTRDKQYQTTLAEKTSILRDTAVSKADKEKVQNAITQLDEKYQSALEIERLLQARGFENTLITFGVNGNVTVDVQVGSKELTRKDVAVIKAVIVRQVETSEKKIVIHPM